MEFLYHIQGMHCASCINKIQSALSSHVIIKEISLHPPLLKIEADTLPSLHELNKHLSSAGNYSLQLKTQNPAMLNENPSISFRAYYPLFLIAAYLIGVVSINNFNGQQMHWESWMQQLMAGFFLVFSAFKLLDIHGFAEGYASYDLLAKYWYAYGYLYPFLELSLGILYLTQWLPTITECATILIMGFSSLGVMNSLLKKQAFQCACLGTLLKVPLSTLTLFEDLAMVVMAAFALMMK